MFLAQSWNVVLIHSLHNAGPRWLSPFLIRSPTLLKYLPILWHNERCSGSWMAFAVYVGWARWVSICHLKGLMCSGCSVNIYCLIEWLIFLSPLSLVLVFFPLQTSCLYPGPGTPAGIQGQWDDPQITHLLLLLWLRPETTDLPWTSSDVFFYPWGLRFFLNPVFHGLTPTEVTWHFLLGAMALTALVISPVFFFCIDSCVMLGCHDNWLISIQFLDWETCSHKELQMMPDCLLPIVWLLPFSGR